MSHYWTFRGEIKLERKPTEEEFQGLANEFDCDVEDLIDRGVGWNSDESIVFDGTTVVLDGNENHFSSVIETVLDAIDCNKTGSGVYYAEDDQAGEWNITDNSLETKEYVDIVSELRHDLAAALKGEYTP